MYLIVIGIDREPALETSLIRFGTYLVREESQSGYMSVFEQLTKASKFA